MSLADTTPSPNRLTSFTMKMREAMKVETTSFDPLAAASSLGGVAVIAVGILVSASAIFASLARTSHDPLLLTVLALFAMLGLFFVFGFAAGHIRVGTSLAKSDLAISALDRMTDPVLIGRADGHAHYVNPAFTAAFGRSDAGPLAAIEALTPGRHEAGRALYRLMRAAERGEALAEDIVLADITGTHRVYRASVTALLTKAAALPPVAEQPANAAVAQKLVVWRFADLSAERADAERRTAFLERALSGVDQAPAGLMTVDGNGVITHVNGSFLEWLGHGAGAAGNGNLRFTDIAGAGAAKLLADVAQTAEADYRSVELDLTRKDGRVVPLTLYVDPVDDGFSIAAIPRGRSLGPTGSDRGAGTQVFDSAPFGMATLDAEGRIVTANAAFMAMMPNANRVIDAVALDVLTASSDDEERQRMAAAIDRVMGGRAPETPVDLTAGADRNLARRIYTAPLAAGRGQDVAALFVVDTTEQTQLERRFAQAQKMEAIGDLAGKIAHDFNNVLQVITGTCDLLLQNRGPTNPDYMDIRAIRSVAKRSAELVANLLGFSRQQTQRVVPLNLGDLASDNLRMLNTQAGEKVVLQIHSERDLWYVKADGAQLINVILNLVKNACDAMPGGGAIAINTRNVPERDSLKWIDSVNAEAGEFVMLEVSDTGSGMSADILAKIFEPFFTTKGIGKGTGLGLASVYGIVKQSGGYIIPESELGRGTTFRIYLPRFLPESDDVVTPEIKADVRQPGGKAADLTGTGRVLLVEDEVEVRHFGVRALKRQGYQVIEASDGVEALAAVDRGEKVDIVVSDVMMPEMDGPTLFKELRKRNPSMKVIFVSGYPNEAFREQLGSEDFAFLPKPFSLPALAAKVKEELAK